MERTPQSSSPSDLRITDVRCGQIRGGHSLFVKIYTNQGIEGHGQAVDGTYGAYYVVGHIAQTSLLGRNPLNINRLQEEIRRAGFFKGAQSGMYVAVMTALLCDRGPSVPQALEQIALAKARALHPFGGGPDDLVAPAWEFLACLERLYSRIHAPQAPR